MQRKNNDLFNPRSQVIDAVWGRESDPIRTVRSMGYAFDERFGGVA
jgi:hypothetical protein